MPASKFGNTLQWENRRFRHMEGHWMKISENFAIFISDPHGPNWATHKHMTRYVAQLLYGSSGKVIFEKTYAPDTSMDEIKADFSSEVYEHIKTTAIRYTGAVTILGSIMPGQTQRDDT